MLQKNTYITKPLGKAGYIASKAILSEGYSYFVEEPTKNGGFAFQGSSVNQIKGTGNSGTIPLGVINYEQYQIGYEPSNIINAGEVVRVLLKGDIFTKPFINEAIEGQNVLIDPLSGELMSSANETEPATKGSLLFENANINPADYHILTTENPGILELNINETIVSKELIFETVSTQEEILAVFQQAFAESPITITFTNTLLLFETNNTGIEQTIKINNINEALKNLLGSWKEIPGTAELINTGWKVKEGNAAGEVVRINKL